MKYKNKIINIIIIILGNALMALGVGVFILPFNIDSGGINGISVVLERFFNPVILITILNWILFFVGLVFLKKDFALKTLLSTIIYPLILNVIYYSPLDELVKANINDSLLASIIGGVAIGVGLGLVYRVGGSTGGLDVISVILYKYKGIKIALSTFIIDFIIVAFGLTVSISSSLYGVISAVLVSYFIDKVIVMGNSSYMMHIVSNESEKINEYIIKEFNRGSTRIRAVGGYDNQEKEIIEILFNEKDYYKIKYNIEKIDKDAFVSVYKVMDVYGKGFKSLITKK